MRIKLDFKKKRGLITFILGSLCFIISQPLLRLPLLTYLGKSTRFSLFHALNPLLTAIFIHGFVNSLIPFFSEFDNFILLMEGSSQKKS